MARWTPKDKQAKPEPSAAQEPGDEFIVDIDLFFNETNDPGQEREKAKRGRGKPSWEPEEWHRKMARNLAGIGIATVDIARIFEISDNTLLKHLRPEIELGRSMARAFAAGKLFKHIREDNLQALIFYMRTQMGWAEAKPGDDDPARQIENLSNDELGREIAALDARAAKAAEARAVAPYVPR